jgi:type I restriction enzyme M protein
VIVVSGNGKQCKSAWFEGQPRGWWRFTFDELTACDKVSLDIFWLKAESLCESDDLADPDVIAQEIVNAFEAALEHFREIASDLGGATETSGGAA